MLIGPEAALFEQSPWRERSGCNYNAKQKLITFRSKSVPPSSQSGAPMVVVVVAVVVVVMVIVVVAVVMVAVVMGADALRQIGHDEE